MIYPRPWELLCCVDPSFLPTTGTCSAAAKTPNITHESSGEGACTLANLLSRNMCAEEHPPRVCAVSREGGLSSTGQQVPLEGDEWKSCTNKRSNRPLAYCSEGKGLVTPLLEEDWDTHDLCTATICEENTYLRRLSKPGLHFPGVGCGAPHCCSLHAALLMGRGRYTVKLCCGGVISSFQVSLLPFRFRRF